MNRTVFGIVCALLFVAALAYMTVAETSVECEVCMNFEGRSACSIASAGSQEEAIRQAQTSACSTITSGVTEVVKCGGTIASSARCKQ